MKKTYFLTAAAAALLLLASACSGGTGGGGGTEVVDGDSAAAAPITTMPYTVSLTNPQQLGTDSLQSFVMGVNNGWWLLIGGRTNGFHGTGGAGRTFPVNNANQKLIAYNPSTGQRYSAAIPAPYSMQLSSTNMEAYQDGSTLWVVGGYGCTDGSSKGPCYNTYPNLTAVDLNIIPAIVNGNTNLSQYFATLQDNRFQVTGGALKKIGNNFYLVMGQNYDTIYVNGVTGQYTETIARFNLSKSGNSITVSNYQTWTNAQYHRRDLVVAETFDPNGNPGISVFGGVFTPNSQQGGPWQNPVFISETNGTTSITVDQNFTQNFNLYDCAHFQCYSYRNDACFTTLIGGITNLVLGPDGKPTQPAGFMPFSKYVSTVVRQAGPTLEFPQATPELPGFVGAGAEFIPNPAMPPYDGSSYVIDYDKLSPGDHLVGWMYGGILSTAEQTNAVSNPSFASATIYEVHINKR